MDTKASYVVSRFDISNLPFTLAVPFSVTSAKLVLNDCIPPLNVPVSPIAFGSSRFLGNSDLATSCSISDRPVVNFLSVRSMDILSTSGSPLILALAITFVFDNVLKSRWGILRSFNFPITFPSMLNFLFINGCMISIVSKKGAK
ncbi:hypothetical protein D3C87_1153530 [compost metagenome]